SASRSPLAIDSSSLLDLKLGPLDREEVTRWHQAADTALTEAQLYSYSGGFPGAIRRALANVDASNEPANLSADEIRALALLVAGAAELATALVCVEIWSALSARGWIRRSSDGYELLHEVQRDTLRAELPAQSIESAHTSICERLRPIYESSDAGASRELVRARLAHHELARGD